MSRSFGGILLTTRPPILISPAVMSQVRQHASNVDLPQPEGPTDYELAIGDSMFDALDVERRQRISGR